MRVESGEEGLGQDDDHVELKTASQWPRVQGVAVVAKVSNRGAAARIQGFAKERRVSEERAANRRGDPVGQRGSARVEGNRSDGCEHGHHEVRGIHEEL